MQEGGPPPSYQTCESTSICAGGHEPVLTSEGEEQAQEQSSTNDRNAEICWL